MQYFHKLFDIHNYPWVKTMFIHKCVKQSQDFTFETPFYLKIKTLRKYWMAQDILETVVQAYTMNMTIKSWTSMGTPKDSTTNLFLSDIDTNYEMVYNN